MPAPLPLRNETAKRSSVLACAFFFQTCHVYACALSSSITVLPPPPAHTHTRITSSSPSPHSSCPLLSPNANSACIGLIRRAVCGTVAHWPALVRARAKPPAYTAAQPQHVRHVHACIHCPLSSLTAWPLGFSALVSRDALRLVRQFRLMSTHVVTVGSHCVHHEVAQALRQFRGVRVEVSEALKHCDFSSGSSSVLYYDVNSAEVQRDQPSLLLRVQEARRRCGRQPVILMVRMDTIVEVSLETLTWLNLQCGVAQQCGLVLVWSVDDAVQYLASLATSAVRSLEFSGAARPLIGDAPLPVLIDALTQTPQVVTRNDVVRIANRKASMADLLMSEASELESIAGLGHKKAARLQHLFRTPFLSSHYRVDSFTPAGRDGSFPTASTAKEVPVPQATGEPLTRDTAAFSINTAATTEGKRLMMRALRRRRDEEDEEWDA
ncbi:hypothetical protein LSCM1_02854 [Leishmania martiniquensis]|uniref:DNA repair protein n=1 Tax=Leishmania martiniquensis TaxID=1580590 RepID=A0A836H3U4_9TRYP|nr:hypothetical protein LSCM1_02854 [Leishmania martiniquensis]